jgi:hypothetical protein
VYAALRAGGMDKHVLRLVPRSGITPLARNPGVAVAALAGMVRSWTVVGAGSKRRGAQEPGKTPPTPMRRFATALQTPLSTVRSVT